jgi:hypothetical protein
MKRQADMTYEQFEHALFAVKFWVKLAMIWLATLLVGIGIGWYAAVR